MNQPQTPEYDLNMLLQMLRGEHPQAQIDPNILVALLRQRPAVDPRTNTSGLGVRG